MDTVGEIEVHVVYGKITKTLPLVVIRGNGPTLLGRNWMAEIRLDWFAIKQVQEEKLWESLKEKYPVFKGTLGKVTGVTAKLVVKENAIPKFFKPCPYASHMNWNDLKVRE